MTATYHVTLPTGDKFGPADEATLLQWAREGRVPAHASIDAGDGAPPIPAAEHPLLRHIVQAPPQVAGPMQAPEYGGDETLAAIVPYRNKPALIGYYFAVFNLFGMLIPVIGLITSTITLVLGINGVKAYSRDRRVKGIAHAWVAIIGGVIEAVVCGIISAAIIIGATR